ncbi:Hypothetical predicted protein [Pelobates cultripes]|uniref:Uncharacterized protein n=1 Tax=Pelobates cultripes TaxID=61616 RepID=A0AAD1RXI8_PELCU|nr:Hypothetical predicted protein [Pelobates cultripes]
MDELDEFPSSGGLHLPSSDEDSELPSTKGDIKALLRKMFAADVATLREEIQTVEGRVKTTEGETKDISARCTQLEAQNTEMWRAQSQLTSRLDPLEDQHRSRNVKIRRIPKTVATGDLTHYVGRLLASLLSTQQARLTEIDGTYRIPRAATAPADTPRDVILQLRRWAAQLTLMTAVRNKANYPFENATLSFYQDLSRPTVIWRSQLKPLTATLRQHSIPYQHSLGAWSSLMGAQQPA